LGAVILPVKVSPALLAGVYPNAVCLLLNVFQSVLDKYPGTVEDAGVVAIVYWAEVK
jgi:hypothetical protein